MAAGLARFAPGCVLLEAESLPYSASTYEGPEGFQRVLADVFQTWKGLEFSLDDVAASGNRVFALITLKGRLGAAETPLTMQVVELWTLRDGMVVELRPFYWDTAKVAEAAR
jgi:hypothetical protein